MVRGGDKKAPRRRLANMSPWPDDAWQPDDEPVEEYAQTFPISERARYTQRLGHDERGRLVEFAVVQSRLVEGAWRRVASYDICHQKGLHVHLFDRYEVEFTETVLRPVASYRDVEAALDYALERVVEHWEENERRSDRGH